MRADYQQLAYLISAMKDCIEYREQDVTVWGGDEGADYDLTFLDPDHVSECIANFEDALADWLEEYHAPQLGIAGQCASREQFLAACSSESARRRLEQYAEGFTEGVA